MNRTVKEAGFRDKFNVNVLGIRRKKEYICLLYTSSKEEKPARSNEMVKKGASPKVAEERAAYINP